ncbi:MAG: DUF3787 domain-containing protein [Clostridiaceae bacterium]|nr:DUF3787 domain-containing protein [Clostridiaceae bacterium]
MTKNKSKENNVKEPIEKHDTAAWANLSEEKPVSKVSVPSDFEVTNAKLWVDENKK